MFALSDTYLFKEYYNISDSEYLEKVAGQWAMMSDNPYCSWVEIDDKNLSRVLVIPRIEGTHLLEWVRSNSSMILELVYALLTLGRSLCIQHNDLKPENLLVQVSEDGKVGVLPIDPDLGVYQDYAGPSTPAYSVSKKAVRSGPKRDRYALAITIMVSILASMKPKASEEAILAQIYGLSGPAAIEAETVLFLTRNGPQTFRAMAILASKLATESDEIATIRSWLALEVSDDQMVAFKALQKAGLNPLEVGPSNIKTSLLLSKDSKATLLGWMAS